MCGVYIAIIIILGFMLFVLLKANPWIHIPLMFLVGLLMYIDTLWNIECALYTMQLYIKVALLIRACITYEGGRR